MRCDQAAQQVAGAGDDGLAPDERTRRHVESCLACQAELVQHRMLLRSLRRLRTEVMEPTPGLLPDIIANLQEAGEEQAVRSLLAGRRWAYFGGLAAAAAGATAGAVVLTVRSRSRGKILRGPLLS